MPKKIPAKDMKAATEAMTSAAALLDPARLRSWDKDGLTITQLRLLGQLDEHDGLGNAEIAERLSLSRPSVSALLERLERHGFVRREISLDDRRAIKIWLQPAGRDAVKSRSEDVRAFAAELLSDLPEDQLKQITEAFASLAPAAPATPPAKAARGRKAG